MSNTITQRQDFQFAFVLVLVFISMPSSYWGRGFRDGIEASPSQLQSPPSADAACKAVPVDCVGIATAEFVDEATVVSVGNLMEERLVIHRSAFGLTPLHEIPVGLMPRTIWSQRPDKLAVALAAFRLRMPDGKVLEYVPQAKRIIDVAVRQFSNRSH